MISILTTMITGMLVVASGNTIAVPDIGSWMYLLRYVIICQVIALVPLYGSDKSRSDFIITACRGIYLGYSYLQTSVHLGDVTWSFPDTRGDIPGIYQYNSG